MKSIPSVSKVRKSSGGMNLTPASGITSFTIAIKKWSVESMTETRFSVSDRDSWDEAEFLVKDCARKDRTVAPNRRLIDSFSNMKKAFLFKRLSAQNYCLKWTASRAVRQIEDRIFGRLKSRCDVNGSMMH